MGGSEIDIDGTAGAGAMGGHSQLNVTGTVTLSGDLVLGGAYAAMDGDLFVLIDNDGTVYRQGDVVWLAGGTEHTSHTETGCLVAVYAEAAEEAPGGST